MAIRSGGADPGVVRPLFRPLALAASGLSAQRRRMEVIANNLANAETTRTSEGGPYRRQVTTFEEVVLDPAFGVRPSRETPAAIRSDDPTARFGGVEIAGVVEDLSEGPLVYDPGHPDADANGYVRYPNVSITEETSDLMGARRLFEANASVFQAVKAMLRRAIEL